MPVNVYYTDKMNVAEYSDAIDTVAYDHRDNLLHVVWHSNQSKVYSYFGLPSAFDRIVDNVEDTHSVRALVKDVTDGLQRGGVTDNAVLVRRNDTPVTTISGTGFTFTPEGATFTNATAGTIRIPTITEEEFVVVLSTEGVFEVRVKATDFSAAATKVYDLFNKNLVDGDLEVTEVKKA